MRKAIDEKDKNKFPKNDDPTYPNKFYFVLNIRNGEIKAYKDSKLKQPIKVRVPFENLVTYSFEKL